MRARSKRTSGGTRRYDATGRRARARHTQAAIVDAARQLFLRDGFHATTVGAIAAAAQVSEETIYKGFGTKAGLVRAIRERALAGGGAVHAEQRSDALQRERDPRRIIEGWGQLTIEVAPRVMPILRLVADGAARDPEMAGLRDQLDAARLQRMRRNARALARGGHLREGMQLARAVRPARESTRLAPHSLRAIHRRHDDRGAASAGRASADLKVCTTSDHSPLVVPAFRLHVDHHHS